MRRDYLNALLVGWFGLVDQFQWHVNELSTWKLWQLVDLSSTAEQTAKVPVAEVIDVDELAEHVEVFDDLCRLHRLKPPHVLSPHSGVLVPSHVKGITRNLKVIRERTTSSPFMAENGLARSVC